MMAAHRPPKNKFGTSGGGSQVTKEDSAASQSFLMCPPPNKKTKFRHPNGVVFVDNNNINNNGDGVKKNNASNDRLMSSSPTDVLAHPAATSNTAAAKNNGIHQEAVVKTLPPSLRGIAEAAKALNSSSRSNNISSAAHQRQQNPPPTPQLVAFPTEALYVLTCCVKTTSKKKVLLANAAARTRAHDDSLSSSLVGSTAGSCSPGSSSSAGESQDCGGSGRHNNGEKKPSSGGGVHPSNPSLERLLYRQKLTQQEAKPSSGAVATPSVFVIDHKHAQHYCHFSQPKMFAIRPKQRSDLVQPSSSSLAGSGGDTGDGSRSLDQLKQDKQELGCNTTNTYSPSSPLKLPAPPSSMTTGEPMTIPPSPKKSSAMVASTSSLSLCFPLTPKLTSNAPSSAAATHAITPIIGNNAAITDIDAKMPPSLQLSSHNNPSNNHSSNNIGTSKIIAVNFSESYEAFSRLAKAFWPGPMIIYAPARMISDGNVNWPRKSSSGSTASSSSSCPSLPSFTNLPSLEAGEGGSISQVPVLPPSVLIPARDLLLDGGDSNDDEHRFFIGMQCPSHPLSRKILTEIHRPRGSSSSLSIKHSISTDSLASFSSLDTSTFQHLQGKQIRCGIAVIGSYIAPLTVDSSSSSSSSSSSGCTDDQEEGTIPATSAANVKKLLTASSSPSSNDRNLNRGAEQIYVVDGEDTTRENFSVPTCNYGGVSPISLVVDGDNRTIYLLRHQGDVGKGYNNLNKEKIYRTLLQPPSSLKSTAVNNGDGSNKAASNKEIDRVITAVLSRWKVVERDE